MTHRPAAGSLRNTIIAPGRIAVGGKHLFHDIGFRQTMARRIDKSTA
jgi:hypothetical protein